MIEIRTIGREHRADINIPNEPFSRFGRILPAYRDGQWSYTLRRFDPGDVTEECFPDEHYDYDAMPDSVFLGAYDGDTCIGLAILQSGFFRYMYLYDLKVNRAYRGQHIGQRLIAAARETALRHGYRGLYTQGQDNNPGACLFYLNSGFFIGGLDTQVYCHTRQAGKSDILFYCEAESMEELCYVTLRERPELRLPAAEWFHSKWGVPVEAYLACMDAYLGHGTEYGWYLCLDGNRIAGGMGVIENDFHSRKDLTPNVCAVYTEAAYRCRGIAGKLLGMVVTDLKSKGISPVYLLTDHTGFYEKYGWEFLCMVQGDGESTPSRMYIHR